MMSRFLGWLAADRAKRYPLPGLAAYYWTGGTPKACSVADISSTGMYILNDERWLCGSVILMTLQRTVLTGQDAEDWIAVLAQVVRSGPDGYGFAFVFSRSTGHLSPEIPLERVANDTAVKRFLRHLKLPKCRVSRGC